MPLYPSACNLEGGVNVAVFSPTVFGRGSPQGYQSWRCAATRNTVEIIRPDLAVRDALVFARRLFLVNHRLPMPAQTEVAQRMDVAWTRATQLVNGKRSVTTDTALRLEQHFGMPAEFWLTLQLRWDLYHAMRAPEVKAIRKIQRAPGLPPLARSAYGSC